MAEREQSHPRPRARGAGRRGRGRRVLGWLPEVLVLLILAAAVADWHYGLGDRWWGSTPGTNPETNPARVLPPEGLDLPRIAAAGPVAVPDTGGQPSARKVARAVSPYLHARRLGRHVVVEVASLADGRVLFHHGRGPVMPASTTKLLTTTAALQTLGPMVRFSTTVRQVPGRHQVVLVGGGDPFLASSQKAAVGHYPARADLTTLARQTAAALLRRHQRHVSLRYDASLFTGPAFNPAWRAGYRSDVVAPISALWVNEGADPHGPGFSTDPARTAADLFAHLLERDGVKVTGQPRAGRASPGSVAIAEVRSAPLGEIIQQVLAVSDNMGAEVIARHVGLAVAHQGSFTAATRSVLGVLRRLGVDTSGDRLLDGSGLSRHDRIEPHTLVDVLRTAASPDHPRLRDVVTGLPVAGFSGSLTYRFGQDFPAARGRVRAKTGTLTGVHALAGIATDLDGDRLVFVAVADRVPPRWQLWAQDRLDQLAGALGACRCGREPGAR
ncbi:MAG TPA: D-alanyl-D-alanine carboxypeptidase/D-alanyl-D-alanine-endopeptidase [Marmoricola sp.]|nr:D-alanyl-D-alanine carboxypeptidase/D-alanyl-D-alanine-endopeptidase [Marmoricola sp.]